MPWARLDDDFHDNGKILSLSHQAFRLYVCALSFAARNRDHGRICANDARVIARVHRIKASAIDDLVAAGLWVLEDGDRIRVVGEAAAVVMGGKPSTVRALWDRMRDAVAPVIFARDGRTCRYCGATDDLQIDHVCPLSRGGTNDPDNLAVACRPCNRSKHAKTIEEWA